MSGTNDNDFDQDEDQEEEKKNPFECLDDSRVTEHDDGTRTIQLLNPAKYANKPLDTITFCIPRGRDWMATDKRKGEVSKAVALAASIANLPIGIFEQMFEEDFTLCMSVAQTMGKKRPIGETSSET